MPWSSSQRVGGWLPQVEALGLRNDTLIIDIFSDNGASAEGMGGTVAELNAQNGFTSTADGQLGAPAVNGVSSRLSL